MLITLLPPRLLRHVEFVFGRREQVTAASNWTELESMIQARPVSAALIDPSADGSSRTAEFERISTGFPSIPVIAYVPLTPTAFRAVAQLSRLGLEHVILYSHDDSAERLVSIVDRVRSSPLTERFIGSLDFQMAKLPVVLSTAVHDMFSQPHKYPNAQDLATSANISIVRLYRSFQLADLAAPKKMVMAARLLRAFAHLRDPAQSIAGVSTKLSYTSSRILAEHTNDVFGMSPSRMRSHLTEDQVMSVLVAWVTREAA